MQTFLVFFRFLYLIYHKTNLKNNILLYQKIITPLRVLIRHDILIFAVLAIEYNVPNRWLEIEKDWNMKMPRIFTRF